jgi:type I restriction enzyme M protein
MEEVRARGYDLTACNPNRKETETLPSPMEIVASLLEREVSWKSWTSY